MKIGNLLHPHHHRTRRAHRRLTALSEALALIALARKIGVRRSLRWAAVAAQAYLAVAEGSHHRRRRR